MQLSSGVPPWPHVLLVFRLTGRNYDAAVVTAGFGGYALGATPVAMANMSAVTIRYGASHMAFIIVPLVAAFFIDLVNALMIPFFPVSRIRSGYHGEIRISTRLSSFSLNHRHGGS
jgi:hypothetical protein